MDGDQKIQKAYESILQHDFERAIEWFEQAVKDQPDNADYHYKLSITYARSNKLNQAISHAERAWKLAPDHEKYKLHIEHLRSRLYMKKAEKSLDGQEHLPYAVSMLTRAITLDPLAVEAYVLLGTVYSELGDYKEAIEAFREASKLDPNNKQAMQLLIVCQQKLRQQFDQSDDNENK